MTRDVKQAIGRPDNSAFIRRCIIYGVILAIMLFAAPSIFAKTMVPMAAEGMLSAWYAVFVPLVVFMMAVGLFRCWRRRWPLAYMRNFKRMAADNGFEICPRCSAPLVMKKRTRSSREKVGERVTTTTYSDGSKSVNREDIYGSVSRTSTYHVCTNQRCALEVEQNLSQSHLPWKLRQIRCLVLNDNSLLTRRHPSASHLLLSRLLIPTIAFLLVIASGIAIYNYANLHNGEWVYAAADKESSRTYEDYQNYLLSLDNDNPNWHMTYEKEPADMLHWLGKLFGSDKTESYTINAYSTPDGFVYDYRFEGCDAGTGIPDGWYTLTVLDGIEVLIDDTNEKIYKQGTAFYDAYAPKLLALNHDETLNVILSRTTGGEHALSGSNDFWMEFARKDGSMVYAYMQPDDVNKVNGGEFRAITNHFNEQMTERWYFSYSDYVYEADDLEGYVYSDATVQIQDDELGKLITESSDDSGSFAIYQNDEAVVEIDIDYLANGYEFCFDEVAEEFTMGFEKDAVYRINTNTGTLTMITTDDSYNEIETDMPLSEHKQKYEYLLSIVPETYIRRIIDIDKAEVIMENAGLSKNYVMKDENGNITAEMKVAFGKIGEVIHHTAENTYAKIELAY